MNMIAMSPKMIVVRRTKRMSKSNPKMLFTMIMLHSQRTMTINMHQEKMKKTNLLILQNMKMKSMLQTMTSIRQLDILVARTMEQIKGIE